MLKFWNSDHSANILQDCLLFLLWHELAHLDEVLQAFERAERRLQITTSDDRLFALVFARAPVSLQSDYSLWSPTMESTSIGTLYQSDTVLDAESLCLVDTLTVLIALFQLSHVLLLNWEDRVLEACPCLAWRCLMVIRDCQNHSRVDFSIKRV